MSGCGEMGQVCAWLSTISYTNLHPSIFTPWLTRTLRSWQMGSLYRCSFKTLLSAISPGSAAPHFQIPNVCWNFLSDDNPLSLFFIVLGLDFLFLYCNWKGSQEGEGIAHVSVCPLFQNPVIILMPLMVADYCRLRKQAIKPSIYQLLSIT